MIFFIAPVFSTWETCCMRSLETSAEGSSERSVILYTTSHPMQSFCIEITGWKADEDIYFRVCKVIKISIETSSGVLCRMALLRTDVLEDPSPSIIKVTRVGELGTKLAVASNRSTLRRNT
jgi:hypothetical protein